MNFSTDLPKGHPLVSYIVASAMKCTKYFPGSPTDIQQQIDFRMHAVILKDHSTTLTYAIACFRGAGKA